MTNCLLLPLILASLWTASEPGDTYGMIDPKGRFVLPPDYCYLRPVGKNKILARKSQNDALVVLDRQGRKQNFKMPPNCELYGVNNGLIHVKNQNGMGVISATGKWILPTEYASIQPMDKSKGFVVWKSEHTELVQENGRLMGKYPAGTVLADYQLSDGLIACRFAPTGPNTSINTYGYLDKTCRIAVGPSFSMARAFCHGLAPVQKYENQKYVGGYIDRRGEMVLGPWDGILPPELSEKGQTYIQVSAGKYLKLAPGRHLKSVSEDEYLAHRGEPYGTKQFVVSRNSKFLVVNGLGTVMHSLPDNLVGAQGSPHGGLIPVAFGGGSREMGRFAPLDSKWGFADIHGNIVIGAKYDFVSPFENGRADVRVHNGLGETCWGQIDKRGNPLVQPIYTEFEKCASDRYLVKKTANHFSTDSWKNADSDKRKFFFEFLKKYNLIGMPKEQLIELLGQPTQLDGYDFYAWRNDQDVVMGTELMYEGAKVAAWRYVNAKQPGAWISENVVFLEDSLPDEMIFVPKGNRDRATITPARLPAGSRRRV